MTALATLRSQLIVATVLAVTGCAPSANTDPLVVTDRGKVDLTAYECQNHTGDTFITRVCYDAGTRHLVLGFNGGAFKMFCRVDANLANDLLSAPTARFYSERVQGTDKPGPHDCGTRP
jgi:hypothetical protein